MNRRTFFRNLALGVASAPAIVKVLAEPESIQRRIRKKMGNQTPYDPEKLRNMGMEWHRRGYVIPVTYKRCLIPYQ